DEVAYAVCKPIVERTPAEIHLLRDYFLLYTPELKDAQTKIAELEKKIPKPLNALVMQERTIEPRVTHRHHRGEFLKSEEVVSPGLPEILPPLPQGAPPNRLTFAHWLVD